MKKLGFVLTLFLAFFTKAEVNVEKIIKFKIDLPDALVEASGGFYPGIGSSLEFSKKNADGSIELYALSDRGPNYPYQENARQVIAFANDFSPKIVKIKVCPSIHKAEVIQYMDLKIKDQFISGDNSRQIPQDVIVHDAKDFKPLVSNFGVDSEAISIFKNGDFVIGDEFEPSINIVDHNTGKIKVRLYPEHGLPEIFKFRNFNRGFEAVTIAPNGKIYGILEGVLNLNKDAKNNSKLIRIVEIDSSNNSSKTFMYPFDYSEYQDSSKVKIGDMAAIDDENFLVIEQGEAKDGRYRNMIYKINISQASDVNNIKINGKELENVSLKELKGLNFVTKQAVINVRDYNWTEKKLEGLTLIDPYTIAISNDNDFAIDGYEEQLETEPRFIPTTDKAKQLTDLWLIKFKEKL
jgi:hypothetical protein